MNAYWADKTPNFSKVTVPAYVTAGWNHFHLRGSVNGWRKIASEQKWLRAHREFEWPDFYSAKYIPELKAFFDRYCKGIRNGWESTPRVRIEVQDRFDESWHVLFHHMRHKISQTMVRWFLEKEDGYPSFRSCGFTDDNIASVGDVYAKKYEHANQIMTDNSRHPLFSDPHDSYQSAREHAELMKQRNSEELVDLFGCSYQDYTPTETK